MRKAIGSMFLAMVILGCSKDEEPKEVVTPWDDQIETMHEFEKVEDFVIDASKSRQQEMEQQLQ